MERQYLLVIAGHEKENEQNCYVAKKFEGCGSHKTPDKLSSRVFERLGKEKVGNYG